jgi:hypothetical protein
MATPERPILFSERGGGLSPATVRLWFPYGQITRNRETLEYSWSPALLHQQSAQLHTFLRIEIQEPRCGATFPSHALYAPIFS